MLPAVGCTPGGWAAALHVTAGEVRPGDGLFTLSGPGAHARCRAVRDVTPAGDLEGIYMPVTLNHNIVVDGVSASVMASYDEVVAALFGPTVRFPHSVPPLWSRRRPAMAMQLWVRAQSWVVNPRLRKPLKP